MGDFNNQLMQILGLLGMYFDAVIVEVEKFFFFRLAVAILWWEIGMAVLASLRINLRYSVLILF